MITDVLVHDGRHPSLLGSEEQLSSSLYHTGTSSCAESQTLYTTSSNLLTFSKKSKYPNKNRLNPPKIENLGVCLIISKEIKRRRESRTRRKCHTKTKREN
jgi:hypothetical protein